MEQGYSPITPDFSEAVDFSAPIPPGVYKFRIESYEVKTSQKGSQYLNWSVRIFGAEGTLAPSNNRTANLMTMLTGKGAGKLKELLKAALGTLPEGYPPGWPEQLIGKEFQGTLEKRFRDDGTEGWPEIRHLKTIIPF